MARTAEHPIEPLLLNRWSSRSMDGKPLKADDLSRLFEAARWAPSCANQQPWRFVYALAGTPHFDKFFDLLAPGNQTWCKKAGALLIVISKKTFDGTKPIPTFSFDAGAAWMALALQASALGLVSHGMAGFDYARAPGAISLPEDFAVDCMIALGYPGKLEDLSEELRAREVHSGRRPIAESAFEGTFPQ